MIDRFGRYWDATEDDDIDDVDDGGGTDIVCDGSGRGSADAMSICASESRDECGTDDQGSVVVSQSQSPDGRA